MYNHEAGMRSVLSISRALSRRRSKVLTQMCSSKVKKTSMRISLLQRLVVERKKMLAIMQITGTVILDK